MGEKHYHLRWSLHGEEKWDHEAHGKIEDAMMQRYDFHIQIKKAFRA